MKMNPLCNSKSCSVKNIYQKIKGEIILPQSIFFHPKIKKTENFITTESYVIYLDAKEKR